MIRWLRRIVYLRILIFFTGHTYFNHTDECDDEPEKKKWAPFIDSYELSNSLERIEEVREGFWDDEILFIIFYYALSMAILLYSSRIIRLRVWFAALIGVGLWAIILGLLFSLANMHSDSVILSMLILYALFMVLASVFIRTRANKLISGLIFLWAIWLQLAVLPLVWSFLLKIYAPDATYRDLYEMEAPGASPVDIWLNTNWELLLTVNLGVMLLLLLVVYFPLARKWASNPEE